MKTDINLRRSYLGYKIYQIVDQQTNLFSYQILVPIDHNHRQHYLKFALDEISNIAYPPKPLHPGR
jgi:hypothetical protein